MESRKVQRTGGSTFTVSLPKDWATDQDLTPGDELVFYQDGDELLVSPTREADRSEGELDVSGLTGERLVSAVMTMYVSGFDVIVLTGESFDAEQRQTIREAAHGLVGVEVLEESDDRVVIQDLLDSAELSIHDAVTRMRLIARSMLEDAVQAAITNDDDLAASVIQRDDDVDRLWFVVSRTFRATIRSPRASEELGLPREVCFDYHSSARQLERIADHAAKISQLSMNLGAIDEDVADALTELLADALAVVDTAMEAIFAEDSAVSTERAHDARESILGLDEHTRHVDELLRELNPHEAQSLGLIVDSLSRSADYGGNIAETALQKAAPQPGR